MACIRTYLAYSSESVSGLVDLFQQVIVEEGKELSCDSLRVERQTPSARWICPASGLDRAARMFQQGAGRYLKRTDGLSSSSRSHRQQTETKDVPQRAIRVFESGGNQEKAELRQGEREAVL